MALKKSNLFKYPLLYKSKNLKDLYRKLSGLILDDALYSSLFISYF